MSLIVVEATDNGTTCGWRLTSTDDSSRKRRTVGASPNSLKKDCRGKDAKR